MMSTLQTLQTRLTAALGSRLQAMYVAFGEINLVVLAEHYLSVARCLRDDRDLHFEQLIDLCGIDYLTYGQAGPAALGLAETDSEEGRFAVVLQLLSVTHNHRVRLKVFAPAAKLPVLPSVVDIWNSANWYEREAFDLFGLVFDGHPDLRRILTDYGFVGHPFRKDFPVSGYVEMRYDADQKRVVYQPLTIEPREQTPRVIREDRYGAGILVANKQIKGF